MAGTGTAHLRDVEDVLLRVEDLVVEFPRQARRSRRGGRQPTSPGRRSGWWGERARKSTPPAVLQLPPPTAGTVRFGDHS